MMARKWLIASALVAAGFATIVALAPSAAAQQNVDIQLSDCSSDTKEIRPLGTPGTYTCTANAQDNTAGVSDPANFVTANLEAQNEEPWMNTIISPSTLVFQYDQSEGYGSQEFQVSVALDQRAPAGATTGLTIGGDASLGGDTSGRNADVNTVDLTVTPDYFNLYNVRLEQKIGQGGPQDAVDFPITIENFSNGETRFEFELAGDEENAVPAGFQTVVPEPTILQSPVSGDNTNGQVTFSVYTPYKNGYVNEIGAIQLDVHSAYAQDTTKEGTSSRVSTLTQARGFYVPGPSAPLVALAIVGSALSLGTVVRRD